MSFTKKLVPDSYIPADVRPEGSNNAALHELPVQREKVFEAYGMLLHLPRTGITGHIIQAYTGGAHFRVLYPNPELPAYPQGCDIWVSDWEIQRAVEMKAVPADHPAIVQFGLEFIGHVGDERGKIAWFDDEKAARNELVEYAERYTGAMLHRVTYPAPADRWMVTG